MAPREGTQRNAALSGQSAANRPPRRSARHRAAALVPSLTCVKRRIVPVSAPTETVQPMRTEQSVPIRLEDYRPPDWLVETVDLDVSLDPTATRVRAALRLKPNPKAAAPAPLVLDGDGLKLVSLKLDGEAARIRPLCRRAPTASPSRSRRSSRSRSRSRPCVDPSANTQLMGLYRSGATYCTQCEADGFRRITYYPDRPDVMAVFTTRIEADKAECPVLLANGNLVAPATCRAPDGISRCGTIRSRSRPTCSRWSAAISPASRTASAPCRAATSCCASLSSPATRSAAPTPWTRSSAPCAGTRKGSAANTTSTSS